MKHSKKQKGMFKRVLADKLFTGFIYGLAGASIIPLFLIISTIFNKGGEAIHPQYKPTVIEEGDAYYEGVTALPPIALQVDAKDTIVGSIQELVKADSNNTFSLSSDNIFLIEAEETVGRLKLRVIPEKRGKAEISIETWAGDSLITTHMLPVTINGSFAYNVTGFFTKLPPAHGEAGGGVANALIGTIFLILIASAIAIPIGLLGGLFLAENGRTKTGEAVRLSMEVLQGVPSIVIGLIAYTLFVKPFGSFSTLSGGIALSIMMLPIIVRTTEETLKMLPTSLKEASYALGAPYYLTALNVLLPAAINGIITAVLVSIGRIAGETAPLLFTSFGNQFMNFNVFKPIAALPHLIFNYATSAYPESQVIAWGASIVLILFILFLNISSRIIAGKVGMNSK